MSKTSQPCLSTQVLEEIGRNQVSPDELLAIEKHVSECQECRELFDSQYTESSWSELIEPALADSQLAVTSPAEDFVDHSAAILKLLGPTDDPNMLGRIGNYEIVGVIGQGGMGAVFKGFDRSLNRFVAIKILLPHLAASGAARKRFAREGQAVAAVVDDHVMAIHCVDEWQGIPYLVMTYSRGVSLQKRLNDNGPLEVREILRIGMQAAKGLAAAHAQGIVHRDIKPSNILLDQNVERVQLVDFGLARAVDDASLTCSGTLAGTPQYMSPEQARAESVDHRSDLFSLGSVLYAMCVGHAPFRAESSYSVLRLIIEKEPRPIREVNAEIPQWLCAIIAKLMSKSPGDRYASAIDLATILAQCLAHVQDPTQHALPSVVQEHSGPSKTKSLITSRFQRWLPIMTDKRIVSLISLLLLCSALLVPWLIATLGNEMAALAFGGTAAVLSLGLAMLSRAEYFSRIVLWGFGLTVCLAVVGIGISVPIYFYRSAAMADRAKAEQMRAQTLADLLAAQAKEKSAQSNSAPSNSAPSNSAPSNSAQGKSEKKDAVDPEQGSLTPKASLEGDTSVEFDKEIGIVTIKGSKSDVARTAAVLEPLLPKLPNNSSNDSDISINGPSLPTEQHEAPAANSQSGSPLAVIMVMHPGEIQKGNTIQRAAAKKTLSLLNDNDFCGELIYGTVEGKPQTKWLWGSGSTLQPVGEHRQDWNAVIAGSMTGDFPSFEPAFQMALDALIEVDAKQKLMIVFTDGDPVFTNESLIDKYRDAGIKVSAVQLDLHLINTHTMLKRLVASTGGTYQYALGSQAAGVESFFAKEVQKLRVDVGPALKKIGLAFHTFEDRNKKFPGSRMVHVDRQSQEFEHPYSWRVAILPYIGQQQLFDEYRFDEAWDSDNNSALLKKMPDIYRSPYASADQPTGHSNMLGFATERGGLGLKSGETISSFKDGLSNTILIVETARSVPWTKPEDLTEPSVQPIPGQPLRFALADGSLGQMNPVDQDKLEKMITRNGHERD